MTQNLRPKGNCKIAFDVVSISCRILKCQHLKLFVNVFDHPQNFFSVLLATASSCQRQLLTRQKVKKNTLLNNLRVSSWHLFFNLSPFRSIQQKYKKKHWPSFEKITVLNLTLAQRSNYTIKVF